MEAVLTPTDAAHLRRALELAAGGRGRVSPNPLVGAVIVAGEEVIGEGAHTDLGGLHAERAALEDCRSRGADPAGATMYVSLEPCAHTGRQPPCVEAILDARIALVVCGSDDPTEKAAGRGPGMLRDGGVEVRFADGPEGQAARLLNQPFRKRARTGRPLVTYKAAMTLDGRVATISGDSRWISSPESRELVHAWRAHCDAVGVGIGTVLADDPLLTARLPLPGLEEQGPAGDFGRQPIRVVFDSKALLPLDSALVATVGDGPVLVLCSSDAPRDRLEALGAAGVEAVPLPGADHAHRLPAALDELGRREVGELILEGGPTLAGAFLDAGEIDELRFFIAPVLLGASEARSVVEGVGAARIADAVRPLAISTETVADDILIRARLREW